MAFHSRCGFVQGHRNFCPATAGGDGIERSAFADGGPSRFVLGGSKNTTGDGACAMHAPLGTLTTVDTCIASRCAPLQSVL